jgi:hypothetical protein
LGLIKDGTEIMPLDLRPENALHRNELHATACHYLVFTFQRRKLWGNVLPEDAYGHWDSGSYSSPAPVIEAASNAQLGALTDVFYKMGIFSEADKILTVASLLGRELSTLRGLRSHEAQELLDLFGIAAA